MRTYSRYANVLVVASALTEQKSRTLLTLGRADGPNLDGKSCAFRRMMKEERNNP